MTAQSQAAMLWIVVTFAAMFVILTAVFILGKKRQQKITSDPLKNKTETLSESVVSTNPVSTQATSESVTVKQEQKSLRDSLRQTEQMIFGRIKNLFATQNELKNFDELEEILYTSDLGPQTVEQLLEKVKLDLSRSDKKDLDNIKQALKQEFMSILNKASIIEPESENSLQYLKLQAKPSVWMVVGVNGAGKTTSIGKLAFQAASQGKKVMVAAGDTFRAAAGAQLKVWSDRAQVEIYSPENVKDPGAVAYEAFAKAKSQGFDLLIVDTAGRLHTQVPLMEELKKVKRVMSKLDESAPHETIIVLDANSGQNALLQAKEFHKSVGLTGVIVTKMDGTAKGGVVIGVANELAIPIRMIGVGEKVTDLRPFSSTEFVDSILN